MAGILAAKLDDWQSRHAALAADQAEQLPPAAGAQPPVQPTQQTPDHGSRAHQREVEADRLVADMQAHVATHGPAGSFWAAGCRWRERRGAPPPSTAACNPASVPRRGAMYGGIEAVWRCHAYEWSVDAEGQHWQLEQPAACRLQPVPLHTWAADHARLRPGNSSVAWGSGASMATWALEDLQLQQQQGQQQQPHEGQPAAADHSSSAASGSSIPAPAGLPSAGLATEVACARHYCVFKNLLYSQGRFFMLTEPGSQWRNTSREWQLGRNRQGGVLHVQSAAAFLASVNASVVPGESSLIDHPFWAHPTALGHNVESLLPLFSILQREPLVRRTPDRLLLLFHQRAHLNDWVRSLLAAVLGVRPGQALPPLLFQREAANPLGQPLELLEGVGEGQWVLFEQVLWPKDVFSGGDRGTADTHDARLLRRMLYAMHGLPHPAPGAGPASPVVTLQRKGANRRIQNEGEVVAMLREFGEVRVVEFTSASTFAQQLAAMAGTGVYVSVHTSNLVNALLLPPGAAVFEVLQRNWVWADIDQFFRSLTQPLGDLHHYAWRAQGLNETSHLNPHLGRLFGSFTAAECVSTDCVESLTQVDVRVDVAALRELIRGRLALIRAGASVAEAALPWPRPVEPAATPKRHIRQPAGSQFGAGLPPKETAEAVWAPVLALRRTPQ